MKKPAVIAIISLVVFALIGGGVFWYLKQGKQTVNAPIAESGPEQIPTSTPQPNDNQKYQGETTKEADGWKKYTNKYFGIEFRFRDEGEEIEVYGSKEGIDIADKKKFEPRVTIDMRKYRSYFYYGYEYHEGQPTELKKYLEDGNFSFYQHGTELISIKDFINKNKVKFYEAELNIGSPKGDFTGTEYYIEYNKIKDANYICISNNSDKQMLKEIVESFRFFD